MIPIRTRGLVVLAIFGMVLGCDESVNFSADIRKPPMEETPQAPHKSDSEKQAVNEFVFKPSVQSKAAAGDGLEVVVQADEVEDPEGFFLEFFALKPETTADGQQELKKIPLGETTIFKPLTKGDSVTAYLENPPKNAWVRTDDGEELRVGFEVKAGHPERKVPRVDLRIVKVQESAAE